MKTLPRLASLAALTVLPACTHDGITAPSARPRGVYIRLNCPGPSSQMISAPFVVNGERMPAERLREIDPARITSLEIMKGDSAVAAYGPDARNGIIIMRTAPPATPR